MASGCGGQAAWSAPEVLAIIRPRRRRSASSAAISDERRLRRMAGRRSRRGSGLALCSAMGRIAVPAARVPSGAAGARTGRAGGRRSGGMVGPPGAGHHQAETAGIGVFGGDLGREAARYASAVVGEPARIVAAGSDNFPDGYPLLVCTLASLADLNRRLPSALPMNRFRPNIVLDGTTAWEEDQIKELRIGDAGLKLVKACTRCAVTGIDQQEGRKGLSPLPVLQEFRFDAQQRGVTFGQNARVARGAGSLLRVGDAVQISG